MQIAYVTAPGRGETDRLLSSFAMQNELQMNLIGVVQTNTDRRDCAGCDMDVQVLPGKQVLRISQSLGRDSSGCRLDPGALEEAVRLVEAALTETTDLLIINKFGKHEAAGRGFRHVIGAALGMSVPVLLGLNAGNQSAFLEFAGDFAIPLTPRLGALSDWAQVALDQAS